MKMWGDPPEIYLYRDAVDFRKSINGLVMVVEQELALSPFAEALYVFCNWGRDKLKLVYWDKTGFALWYKRLEQDKFKWPTQHSGPTLSLSPEQWQWLLAGYDVVGHRPVSYASVG
jgi:transposase